MPEDDVLTVLEAAELLKLNRQTVQRLAAKGALPGRKVGRAWRFSRQALLEWLAGPEPPPAGERAAELAERLRRRQD